MPLEAYQLLIYLVFVFAIIAYSTLDGFDLGVGCLHLFAKGDIERRLMINSIGPVWDGNSTWIVIGAGVLFAGFPKAFSTVMTNLYTLVMIVLFGIMLRGASIEFRSKSEHLKWRKLWDVCFFIASFLLALDVGIILGNLIQGLPINKQGVLEGDFCLLFRPYPLLIGLFAISIFSMHGSIYLLMKTEGVFHKKIKKWVNKTILIFLGMWAITTASTFVYNRHMITPFFDHPSLTIFALLSLLSIAAIPRFVSKKQDGLAFTASCFSIIFLLILFGIGTFPNLFYSTLSPEYSLTLFNSSATKTALLVLILVATTGIPLAFFYGSYVHKVFKGKIKLDHMSY